jgi:hypothetical protein
MVQLAAAAREVPQVLADLRNDDALVPVKLTVPSVTAVVPVFFTVTTLAAVVAPTVVEAKASDAGETDTVFVAATPVPLASTVWVPEPALSEIVRVAVSVPATCG